MNLAELKNINVVLYLLNKTTDMTLNRLQIVKLIWLSDRWHLNQYGRTITKSSYSALPKGPVASEILNILNREDLDQVKPIGHNNAALTDVDIKFLSTSDREILDNVWDNLGDIDRFDLVEFSHKFPEWRRFEKYLNDISMPNSYPIVMEDFFEKNEYMTMVNDDVRESSKQEFLLHRSISSFLNS